MTCLTCPSLLKPYEQRNGMRRCKACRKKNPGQMYTTKGKGYPLVINPQKLAPKKSTDGVSFWVGCTREELNKRAAEKFGES